MLGDAQRLDSLIHSSLLFPVDEQFRPGAGYAADVLSAGHGEEEGFVGHPGFEAFDIADV